MRASICIFLLVVFAKLHFAHAQSTIYISNLGQASGGSRLVGSDSWLAEAFSTGMNPSGYSLNSIQLLAGQASGNPSGFSVSIYSHNTPVLSDPGSSLSSLSGADPAAGGIFTYTTPGISLLPSSTYFVVLTAATPVADGAYSWVLANSVNFNSGDGWLMGPELLSSSDGLLWNRSERFVNFEFAINATAVPEPSSLALLAFCVLIFGTRHFCVFLSRRQLDFSSSYKRKIYKYPFTTKWQRNNCYQPCVPTGS